MTFVAIGRPSKKGGKLALPSVDELSVLLDLLGDDISFRRFAILLACKTNFGSWTNKHLADYFSVSAPAMSCSVSELEKRGLVERISQPYDKREVLINVTPKGDELLSMLQAWQ